jgi:exopolysaccharide production protein ExoQ
MPASGSVRLLLYASHQSGQPQGDRSEDMAVAWQDSRALDEPESVSPGQRQDLSTAETCLFLAAAFLYWTDILRLLFPGTDGISATYRITHFAFYGLFVAALLRDLSSLRRAMTASAMMVAFIVLPMLSALWSINPAETATRAVTVMGSSLFGYYVATQVAGRTTLRLLAITATAAAALSLFLIFLVPSMGRMSEGEYVNVWSGAWVHKNGMGQMCGLGVLICLIVLLREGMRGNTLIGIGLGLNLILLAGSRSLTSQLVVLISLMLLLTVGRFVRFVFANAVLLAVLCAPSILYFIVTLSIDDALRLLTSFGKDATLSSRMPLWQILLNYISERFWFGYGYEAFFTDANFIMQIIEQRLHFRPWYSHNGYIEIWLALGAVGFMCMAALFVRFTWLSSRLIYQNDKAPLFQLCFIYVPIFLMQNTAEVTILQRNSMSWSLFVMLYVYVALAARAPPHGETSHTRKVEVAPPSRLSIV